MVLRGELVRVDEAVLLDRSLEATAEHREEPGLVLRYPDDLLELAGLDPVEESVLVREQQVVGPEAPLGDDLGLPEDLLHRGVVADEAQQRIVELLTIVGVHEDLVHGLVVVVLAVLLEELYGGQKPRQR